MLCEAAPVGGPPALGVGEHVVVRSQAWRLIRADAPGLPAFYRLIWAHHVREFSELPRAARLLIADVLAAVEAVLIGQIQPAKVNLASLGNQVAHQHWHIVARFEWDPYWPGSVWSQPLREADAHRVAELRSQMPMLDGAIATALAPYCSELND